MFGKRKPVAYSEARRLRAEGLSYRRIAAALEISASSAYAWTSDIRLEPEQIRQNLIGSGGPRGPIAGAAWSELCRQRRRAWQDEGRARARLREPLHMAGCMLYWAEGSKGRNTVQIVNSDASMMRFTRSFLSTCFDLDSARFTMRLNVYLGNDLALGEIEEFWLEALELPRASLRKHTVDHLPTSSSGTRRNRLPYGVCTLNVLRSTAIVQHIYGAIQEYGGFQEPRWLDGPVAYAPAAAGSSRSGS